MKTLIIRHVDEGVPPKFQAVLSADARSTDSVPVPSPAGFPVERRLNTVRTPGKIGRRWPKDRVNILLVTARPYAADVRYRSISRPLVELIDKQGLPAQVTVLRPPTFERLQEHLRERPNHY